MENSRSRGILVAIEGIDGAGKTTHVKDLSQSLARLKVPFITTKEPTGGPWGRKIRASAVTGRLPPEEELEAFLADRREHVRDVIGPALRDGLVVITDRYYLSTIAYQGARGLDPAWLLEVNSFAPEPNILIVLDIDPSYSVGRLKETRHTIDKFEQESELAKARDIFRYGLKDLGVRNLYVLDAARHKETISLEIATIVLRAVDQRGGE